jgi:hypothetical protein
VQADAAHDHVLVAIEPGRDAKEELAVEVQPDGAYRLLAAPALTLGLAVGDVFTVDPATSRARVTAHGGNITIWLYPRVAQAAARTLDDGVRALGGVLHGSAHDETIFIFTVPVTATFPAIEALFDGFVEEQSASEWYFGNVYADDGVTPLGWWERVDG